ncbi:tetratricopeptide repeat protein [Marivirga sp.]|uniref:tetratricopeptide repeat protein n=1 Tax=Marivirga sp. TaxID=2018662 RepID=UPI002D7E2B2B|nr:tetratricopeptide repeat protein [Marivirga sp.]HET8859658.1 tetratricopeptide repeat protein [Marivirga sp.]
MRKIAVFLAFFLVVGQAFAQNKNVRKAERALEKGELTEAKELINPATEDEETKNDPKTWFTRGSIYQAILDRDGFSEEIVKEISESYNKVFELVEEDDKYYTLTDLKVQELWGGFINQGSDAYSAKDFETALTAFEKALLVLPEDTTATLYAGIVSQQMQNNEKALKYFYRLIDLDYQSKEIYESIISIERYGNKDTEKALEVAKMATEQFPEENNFEKLEISFMIELGQVEKAKDRLNEAIKKEPNNALLYSNLGILYDELEQYDKASEAYLKAIEIEPNNFEALYNYAVNNYNKAAEIQKEANNMDLATYRKEGKAKEAEAAKYWKIAEEYFVRTSELRPEDVSILETLQTIYSILGENEKAAEMKKKADKLKSGE